MAELKPCPFCGGEAVHIHFKLSNEYFVICLKCRTYMDYEDSNTDYSNMKKKKAVLKRLYKKWNSRPKNIGIENDKTKNCPFCNSSYEQTNYYDYPYCVKCELYLDYENLGSYDNIYNFWNTRVKE